MALFFSMNCAGQCEEDITLDTSFFFKHLNKKTDTIYFKASFSTIGKPSQRSVLQKLSSKGLIKISNYTTAVGFIPIGSKSLFYLPYKDIDSNTYKSLYSKQNQDEIICIKGIVIQGFETINKKPFFLIDKVWIE